MAFSDMRCGAATFKRFFHLVLSMLGIIVSAHAMTAQAQLPNVDPGERRLGRFESGGHAQLAVSSVDGNYLFTYHREGREESLRIWDFATGEAESLAFKRSGVNLKGLAPLDGRKTVVALSEKGDIYEIAAEKPYSVDRTGDQKSLRRAGAKFTTIATSPNGNYLVIGSAHTLHLRGFSTNRDTWNLDDDILVQSFDGKGAEITALATTNSANLIAVGFSDGTIRMFEKDNPDAELTIFTRRSASIVKLAYDGAERFLYILDAAGDLAVLPMGVSASQRRPVLEQKNVSSFDASRLRLSTGIQLVVVDRSGAIHTFDDKHDHISSFSYASEDVFGKTQTQAAVMDYERQTNNISKLVVLDRQAPTLRFINATPGSAELGATLLTLSRGGWLMFDASSRYDGSTVSIETTERARRTGDFSPALDVRRLPMTPALRNCRLLRTLKGGKAEPLPPRRRSCDKLDLSGQDHFESIDLSDNNTLVHFKLKRDAALSDIQVMHQGRPVIKPVSADPRRCPRCFMLAISPVDGVNTVYIRLRTQEGVVDSDRKQFLAAVKRTPKFHLILIAVSDYVNHRPLLTPGLDLDEVAKVIESRGQTYDVHTLRYYNGNFNPADLKGVFESLGDDGNDRVWIMMSGHGLAISPTEADALNASAVAGGGARTPVKPDFYFLGKDAPYRVREALLYGQVSQLLPARQLGEFLRKLSSRRVIITIDTCFSGVAGDSLAEAVISHFDTPDDLAPLGVHIFVSAARDQSAFDGYQDPKTNALVPSPTTLAMLEVLNGKGGELEDLTVLKLFEDTKARVSTSQASYRDVGVDSVLWSRKAKIQ